MANQLQEKEEEIGRLRGELTQATRANVDVESARQELARQLDSLQGQLKENQVRSN